MIDKHDFAIKDPKPRTEIWFIHPGSGRILKGKIFRLYTESARRLAVIEPDGGKPLVDVDADMLFADENSAARYACLDATEKIQKYKAMMPDVKSCLNFAYGHAIFAGEHTDWPARTAFEMRMLELGIWDKKDDEE